MRPYVGVRQVEAEPADRGGRAGYRVVYPEGYELWSPADVFEGAYLELGDDPTRVDESMIESLDAGMEVVRMGNHTVVRQQLRTGFSVIAESACVDAQNYDEDIGTNYALEKAEDEVWGHMGFVLAWARNGLKKVE